MKDKIIVREVEHKGIKVAVEINLITKEACLVEFYGSRGEHRNKRWLFAGRGPEYLKTWLHIFDAMKLATEHAIEEIEAATDDEIQEKSKLLELLARASKNT